MKKSKEIKECKCSTCKYEGYNESYDAFFCKDRNIWLEKGCSDKKCIYCCGRPKYPDMKRHFKEQKEIVELIRRQKEKNVKPN